MRAKFFTRFLLPEQRRRKLATSAGRGLLVDGGVGDHHAQLGRTQIVSATTDGEQAVASGKSHLG
jgi:hypothetical protein